MKTMKMMLVAAALCIATAAGAQEPPSDSYEFILAKMAASEARFDDALNILDKVIQRNPNNAILRFERATVLIDAGRMDQAEAELRKVVATTPDLYDAQRVLGRMLVERAGNDRAKLDEALDHLRAAFKLYPCLLYTSDAADDMHV